MTRRIAVPILAACISLGGCAFFLANQRDLNLAEVEVIDLRQRPERNLRWPERGPFHAVLIRFTTATDLVRFKRRNGTTVLAYAAPCDTPASDPHERPDSGRPGSLFTTGIYDQSQSTGGGPGTRAATPPDAAGRYHFHSFVMVASTTTFTAEERARQRTIYDLREANPDICFRLYGGNMVGSTFTSNTIRIPAATLRAALDRAGL